MIKVIINKHYFDKGTLEEWQGFFERKIKAIERNSSLRKTKNGVITKGYKPVTDLSSWWPNNIWVSEFYED